MAADAKPRVYHISIWRYLLLWWVLGPLLLLGAAIPLIDPKSAGAGIIIVLIMAPFFILWHWFVRRTRLEISADGLRLREVGGGMQVPWTDITGFRADRGHEGFITAQPMQNKGAENLAAYAGMQMPDERDLQLIAERRFIPIKPFACHLRRGDLRETIASFAPHLREPLGLLDAPPPRRPAPTAAERRKDRLVVLVVAIAFAVGFLLIALGPRAQDWFFSVAWAVIDPFAALLCGFAAWSFWNRQQRVLAILTALFTLVMAGWVVQNFHRLGELFHAAH